MTENLIPVLVFLSVVAIGAAVLVVRGVRRRILQARLFGLDDPGRGGGRGGAATPATGGHGVGLIGAVDQIGRAISPDKPVDAMRERLAQAGCYDEAAPTIYVGAQLLLVLLGLAFGGLAAFSINVSMSVRGCVILGVVAALGLMPNLYVTVRRRNRTADVRSTLPDAIDLLEICVSSGMGLDIAWNSVADEIRGVSPVLADEMALANLEMHLGAPRARALRNMARRTGAAEISSLVATLVQSERFGTSVSQALRTFADAMRTERSQRAEEAAEKLMVKLLFPMVVFIFPCMFLVILGPAGVRIAAMFGNN